MANGGIISTGSHPKGLWPGVMEWWTASSASYPKEYKGLVDFRTSTKSYEDVVQDTGFGLAPVKDQGAGIAYQANVQGFTTRATHVTYALGYAVTLEQIQDNQYLEISQNYAKANAFSQNQTRENIVANVFNYGFSSALQTIGDGQAFFSTTHPNTAGGTFANKPVVDADLSEASLEDALIAISLFKDDAGLIIAVKPQKLVVAPQNMFNASRILKSTYQNDTANNAINAMRAMNILPDGFDVNHYFTDANAWFVKNQLPMGTGLTFYERIPVTFDKDNDFNTKNALASSITRFSVAVANPRHYYGSSGAS